MLYQLFKMKTYIISPEFQLILRWSLIILFSLVAMVKLKRGGYIFLFVTIFFICLLLSYQFATICVTQYEGVSLNIKVTSDSYALGLMLHPIILGFIIRAFTINTDRFRSELIGYRRFFDKKTLLSIIGAYFGSTLFFIIFYSVYPSSFYCRV